MVVKLVEEMNEEEETNEYPNIDVLGEESEITDEDTNGKHVSEIKEENVLEGDRQNENCDDITHIIKSCASDLESDNTRMESKTKKKKEKKKQKKKVLNLHVESDSDHCVENEFLKSPDSSSDEFNSRKKKRKGKNKKSMKEKVLSTNCSDIPTDLPNEINNKVNVDTFQLRYKVKFHARLS